MSSLNDIVRQAQDCLFEGIAVELRLDKSMPDIYEDFEFGITLAFSRLFGEEISIHGGPKCRVTTGLNGDMQYVWVDSLGKPDSEKLRILNEDLEKIADGMVWYGERSGNRIVANIFRNYHGRMRLECIDDPEYTVRTTVEIPLNK